MRLSSKDRHTIFSMMLEWNKAKEKARQEMALFKSRKVTIRPVGEIESRYASNVVF